MDTGSISRELLLDQVNSLQALLAEVEHQRADLEEEHARVAAIVDSSEDAIISTDVQGKIVRVNTGAQRLLGYTADAIIGRPLTCLVAEQNPRTLSWALGQLVLDDSSRPLETELVGKDGGHVEVSVTFSPVRNVAGVLIGLAVIARDVTARKRAEALVQLRGLAMDAATEGIVIADATQPDQPLLYVNSAFQRITGYTSSEVIGKNCRILQGPDTDRSTVSRLHNAIREGVSCSVEVLNYKSDGSPFWNALSISPLRDSTGVITHFVGVLTDITQRKRLEEQFRVAQKMEAVGRLAGGIAHDFNNLLTVVTGFSQLLLERYADTNPAREMVKEIFKAGERAAVLTRQLLAFGRRQVLTSIVLDLNEVIRDAEGMLRRLIGEDIELHTQYEPHVWQVRADPGQMQQVLLNLAVNSRDAMPRGGRLWIHTSNVDLDGSFTKLRPEVRPGSYVMLAVGDTGCGMDKQTRSRIFEPFFTTKEPGKGTGLGLAMVYGLVKQSEGYVYVHSKLGRGTVFKIYLPRTDAALAPAKPAAAVSDRPHGHERILIVEDDASVRTLTRRMLSDLGYSVLEASDGHEALRICKEATGRIDLVVTDVVMPKLSGRELAEQLEAIRPSMRVLFVTGYTDDSIVRHGVRQGDVNCLQKPFSADQLAHRVHQILHSLPSE